MSSTTVATATPKSKSKPPPMSDQDIQQAYSKFQNDLQGIANKIGELEGEAEEHGLVLQTLEAALETDPSRKCFRLIGGVLVERTVQDVVPALRVNREGIQTVIKTLADQYKTKETELETFKRDYNIRIITK